MASFKQIIDESNATARDYQDRVVSKAIEFMTDGVRSTLINSPTGSGKTVMGLAAAAVMQRLNPDLGVGWCAMRRNLLSQACDANRDLAMGVDCITPISMFDKSPPTTDAKGRPIRLLIVDEAQHDAASSMGHLHNTIRPDWVLGLSATPYRTDKLKLCFEKVIRDAGIHQLIQQGFLSKYHQFTIPSWTVDTVCDRFLAEQDRWGKSAIYWHKLHDAIACTDRLLAAGVRCEMVLGTQTMSERESRLSRFDRGELDVLVNLFVLTEGWDCPSLQTAWVRDSVKGPTVQMAGRVFRRHKDHQFKQIVQSQHTKHPMQKTATPAEQAIWMGDSWRSVKASDTAKKVISRAMMTLAHTQTDMPDYLTARTTRNRGRFTSQQDED